MVATIISLNKDKRIEFLQSYVNKKKISEMGKELKEKVITEHIEEMSIKDFSNEEEKDTKIKVQFIDGGGEDLFNDSLRIIFLKITDLLILLHDIKDTDHSSLEKFSLEYQKVCKKTTIVNFFFTDNAEDTVLSFEEVIF
jgi:hypothetical protein